MTSNDRELARLRLNALQGDAAAAERYVRLSERRGVSLPLATCSVFAPRREEFEKKMATMAKRALKHGMLPPVAIETGTRKEPVYRVLDKYRPSQRTLVGYHVYVDFNILHPDLKMDGGWTFLGTVEHTHGHSEGGNILRIAHPDESLNLKGYREAKPVCDHCETIRRRKDTYLVLSAEGDVKQVGRTCLKDYMGIDAARSIGVFNSVRNIGEENWGPSDNAPCWADFETFIAVSQRCILMFGWTSKGEAYHDPSKRATASRAFEAIMDFNQDSGEFVERAVEEQGEFARAAIAWGRAIDSETDNDYLSNLRAVAHLDALDPRHMGLAASLPQAYSREVARADRQKAREGAEKNRKPLAFFGQPGDKIGRKCTKAERDGGKTSHPSILAKVVFRTILDSEYGDKTLIKMEDDKGHVFAWYKSGYIDEDFTVGVPVEIVGTVRQHKDYRGYPQTILQRCILSLAP